MKKPTEMFYGRGTELKAEEWKISGARLTHPLAGLSKISPTASTFSGDHEGILGS